MDNSTSDGERIAELYREMYGQMFAYASCILRDRDLAEEAVQDAFCILCVKAEDSSPRLPSGVGYHSVIPRGGSLRPRLYQCRVTGWRVAARAFDMIALMGWGWGSHLLSSIPGPQAVLASAPVPLASTGLGTHILI